jgi:hypothetical protein
MTSYFHFSNTAGFVDNEEVTDDGVISDCVRLVWLRENNFDKRLRMPLLSVCQ